MHLNKLTWVIVLLLSFNIVNAVYINNTFIESVGLGTSINVTHPWNLTELIVDSNWIFARNMTSSNSLEASNEGVTWNLSESTAAYSGINVPYYSASSLSEKTITSGFTGAVIGGEATLDVDYCDISSIYYTSALGAYDAIFTPAMWDCANDELNLSLDGIDPGNNVLIIDYDIAITNCTDGNVSIEFSIYNETDPTALMVADAEVNINYWVHPSYRFNFSHDYSGNNTYRVCLSPSEATIYADIYIKYTTVSGFTHRYYVHNGSFTNTTTYLTMYNTNTTAGFTDLKITTRLAETYGYFVNVVSSLERFYPGENVWRVVQMGKSGDYGLSVFDVIEKDVDYKLTFRDTSNHLLKSTDTMKFKQDPTTGIIDLTFLLDEYVASSATTGFTSSYSYDNDTSILTMTWSDSTASTSAVRLFVTKEVMSGTTEICDDTYYSSSGTSTCNMTGYSGEIFVVVEADDEIITSEWVDIEKQDLGDLISTGEGALWTAAILVTVVAFGLFSPAGAIISMIIGIIIVAFLGIFPAFTTPLIIVVCVLGIAIGIKVKS